MARPTSPGRAIDAAQSHYQRITPRSIASTIDRQTPTAVQNYADDNETDDHLADNHPPRRAQHQRDVSSA